MVIIDFSETPKQAFRKGFTKGISAPIMLFGQFHAPELLGIEQVIIPNIATEEFLVKDWQHIGLDFKHVIDGYATKETNITSSEK